MLLTLGLEPRQHLRVRAAIANRFHTGTQCRFDHTSQLFRCFWLSFYPAVVGASGAACFLIGFVPGEILLSHLIGKITDQALTFNDVKRTWSSVIFAFVQGFHLAHDSIAD